jgi:hypothetical protein
MINRLLRLAFSFSAAASIASFLLGVVLWPGVVEAVIIPVFPPLPTACGCVCATGSTCGGPATPPVPPGTLFFCVGGCAGSCTIPGLWGDCDATCGCKAVPVAIGPAGGMVIVYTCVCA